MKKIYLLAILLCIAGIAFSQVTHSFSFTTSEFKISTDKRYTFIENEGFDNYTTQEGAPKLPILSRSFVLPAGSTVTNVSVSNQNQVLLGTNWTIYPAQPPRDWSPELEFVPPDPAIYNSSVPFPAETVVTNSDLFTLGYHVITLDICPFKYIPNEKKLYLYQNVDISIQYTTGQAEKTEKITRFREELSKEVVAATVVNPELLDSIGSTAKTVLDGSNETDKLVMHWRTMGYEPDYLIITNEALKPYFQDLADYKIKRGIPTLVVTTEDIYGRYPGVDNAEKIRNYLKAAYHYWGTGLFVLLGGDTAIIPGRLADYYSSLSGLEINPSDLYYCDVYKQADPDYNWNLNGNEHFGEDNDGLDLGGDNIIGRAPVDTEDEANNFIQKVIAYEGLTGVADKSYVNNMLFLGAYYEYPPDPVTYDDAGNITNNGDADGQQWHTRLANESFLNGYNKQLLFDDHQTVPGFQPFPGDEELGYDTTMERMNSGLYGTGSNMFHLISHLDHGGPFGIGVSGSMNHDSLYREDMDNLFNGNYLQIMYSTACLSGKFTQDCFAEHYINSPGGGGVAILANSATVGTGAYDQDAKLFQSIYSNSLGANSYLIGIAFTNARSGYYNSHHRKVLTLFGEPTMATWSATPQEISLTVPSSVSINNTEDNLLPVTIGQLTQDAVVTLYKYNETHDFIEVFAKQKIPAGTTSATFILHPDTPGELLVTVTAKNYLPKTATVNISMPQSHLYITGFTFEDENGNDIPEQGEDITLTLSLTNSGNTAISNIHTTLSGVTGLAAITNAEVNYSGSVAPGATIQLSGYTFTLGSEDLPDFIEFFLDITTTGIHYQHIDNFYLGQASSELSLGARNILDNTGQSILSWDSENSPFWDFSTGTSLNLDIAVVNNGDVSTGQLNAVLTSSAPEVDISTGTAMYPDIQTNSEETNTSHFVFQLSTLPTGPLPFTLTLTNALGHTWEFEFDLNEMLPPLITGFDFTSTTSQITLSWDPVSDIGGYNIYRNDTENGTYEKMNDLLLTGSAMYTDTEVNEETEYYYKVSVVTSSGNELPLDQVVTQDTPPKQGYIAWTSLEPHGSFPVTPDIFNKGVSSPTLYDVDGNGTKEIFVNYRRSDDNDGIIMGLHHDGQEIFNIDGNETTTSGFAITDLAMVPNSAVGDLDNDGHAEVLSIGRNNTAPGTGKLYVYKTIDENEDSNPDPFWSTESLDIGHRTMRNPVLYDIDGDGFLEIIVADEKQRIHVYDKNKNIVPGWDFQIGNKDYSEGEVAVADLDGDGTAEIAFGVLDSGGTKGAIYIYNHDGTPFTTNPFKEFATNERGDGGITFADIDNDGEFELLMTTRGINNNQCKIYAFNLEGTPVEENNWNGNFIFNGSTGQFSDAHLPRIAVGDLDGDGSLEVVFGSKDKLYILNGSDGTPYLDDAIDVPGMDIQDNGVALADIDGIDGIEIIVNSGGVIKAFKNDGSECIGWGLQSDNGSPFVGTPSVADIDNDGLNEVVASTYDCTTYVWDTDGDANKIEWGSYRADSYNTGTYKHGCVGEIDLYIGDNLGDTGVEPNPTEQNMWSSPNIWVRNGDNDDLEHESPEYNENGAPNYIKVRVVNRGCDPSTGTETLTINWAKANTSLNYPDNWNDTMSNNQGYPMGGELDPVTIPVIQPGEETIVTIPWVVPNPNNYTEGPGGDNPWHFCLLATIVSDDDPLSHPYTSNPNIMVRENNNQAWRNVTVVDLIEGRPIGGTVAITNHSASSNSYDLLFNADDRETGKLIFEEAEVTIVLDSVLYNAWVTGGRQLSSGIHQNASSLNNPVFHVTSDNAKLKNLVLSGNQMGLMAVRFNMLTKELTSKPVYNYFVTQIDHTTGEIIGGETYEIRKPPRAAFYAEAGGDMSVDKNETVTLVAEDIDESAVYNWYDEDGNLIYSGTELTVVADIARTYKLEIIADADGYKDYTEVEIGLNPNILNGIVPNPASSSMTVDYNLNAPSSAYLSILGYVGNDTGVERNYMLDTESSDKTIDISGYAIGFYTVKLICDGEVVGTLNLIKQ